MSTPSQNSQDRSANLPPAPDVIRAASAELIVSDLAASRAFYVDVLRLVVTEETDDAIYLRSFEEYLHHSLVLRKGPVPACAALSYRVRSAAELDVAQTYYQALGVPVRRLSAGTKRGIGEIVAIEDPLGFPVEFFYDAEHVERFTQRYDVHGAGAIARLDHFNVVTPDIAAARSYYEGLDFKVSEDIQDSDHTVYAAWMYRKATVHDVALTGGDGPRLHHIAFSTNERHQILHICDQLGALRQSDKIERGPGRHGVSNAFYLYLRDPDGHRIEIYTQDYYTGDPDNPVITWDVHDNQRRDWWGTPVVPSWYAEASPVLNLDGEVADIVERVESSEAALTIGADGFSYTRRDDGSKEGVKLGEQV
ncbi:3,4-dihydroxyphenylacetate 2,3-dioxygenase [Saxibacter everestensis]|uniref:3,4-dihydroxyphenylacetate 2,3-dioxygenase n=1 Tax=Saxibacter everestensis TaxID=2909229 RepID=A0ABY8QSG2_9MICO|nr:3,4-dihydroxyphenylacetate 2,3-dioxygenase [Brevibacteriaceae bacterium ZFBP1038]